MRCWLCLEKENVVLMVILKNHHAFERLLTESLKTDSNTQIQSIHLAAIKGITDKEKNKITSFYSSVDFVSKYNRNVFEYYYGEQSMSITAVL